LKTEDSDAKSPDSSISSDGLVLENGAIALSPSSHSVVQETPIRSIYSEYDDKQAIRK